MANWRSTRTPGSTSRTRAAARPIRPRSPLPLQAVVARPRARPGHRQAGLEQGRKDRSEVLVWLGSRRKGADHLAELAARGPTLGSLGDEWLDGVERGRIGRRRGRGKPYSETTIASMRRRWENKVQPEFGDRFAGELTEMDWQRWIDQLAREGLSRSSIAQLISLASGIYARASAPSRRLVERNPLRLVELPPNDEKPRMRVAFAPEAAALLAALSPRTVSPTRSRSTPGSAAPSSTDSSGPRSSTATRSRPASSSCARRATPAPIAAHRSPTTSGRSSPTAWERQGRPREGKVLDVSVMSGKHAERADAAWAAAGLTRITLHECRHTYASLLMAAGYTIKELMEFMGHADLQMVNRYVKLLPQPGEDDAAARLNDYLRRSASDRRDG